jgi:hypothetical protein
MSKLDEILSLFNEAKNARQEALGKIRAGMEELAAAESQMESALSLAGDYETEHEGGNIGGPVFNYPGDINDFFRMFQLGAKGFGFGDLF